MDQTNILLIITILITISAFGYILTKMNNKDSANSDNLKLFQDSIPLIKQELGEIFRASESNISKDVSSSEKLIMSHINTLNTNLEASGLHSNKELVKITKSLETQLDQSNRVYDSSNRIEKVLTNSSDRGRYGEFAAKDILDSAGLIEGTNYTFQKQMENGNSRPDFSINIPPNRVVNLDVKFPLSNYNRMCEADTEEKFEQYSKLFISDIKDHINTLANKDYIDPTAGTLDYVILYLPLESIYQHICDQDRSVLDLARKSNVILTTPSNLIAIIHMIRSSTYLFSWQQNQHLMIDMLKNLRIEWKKIIEAQSGLHKSLVTSVKKSDTIMTTRKNKFEKPFDQIISLGQSNPELNPGQSQADTPYIELTEEVDPQEEPIEEAALQEESIEEAENPNELNQ